jgi:hypothetical protein
MTDETTNSEKKLILMSSSIPTVQINGCWSIWEYDFLFWEKFQESSHGQEFIQAGVCTLPLISLLYLLYYFFCWRFQFDKEILGFPLSCFWEIKMGLGII